MGPSTPDRPPAVLLVVKLATGNVHLMQGWVHSSGQHAGTVREHVEPAFVADNGLVYTALVALALVVCLRKTKVWLICGSVWGSSLILSREKFITLLI